MKAEIHSVDKERLESEGQTLRIQGAITEVKVRRDAGLAFDEKDQYYLVLRASGRDGGTHSELTAELSAEELQQLFDAALEAKMIDGPVSQRALDLLDQLREELSH